MPRRNKKKSKKQIQNNNKNNQHQAQQRARQTATETALLISDHGTMQSRCQKTLEETVQRVQPHGEIIMEKAQPFRFVVDMGDGSEIVAQCGRNIEENIMGADRYRRESLEVLPLGVHNGFCDELLQLTINSLGIAGSTNKTTVKLTDGEYHYWFMAVVGVMSDCVHFGVRIYRHEINPEGVVEESGGTGQRAAQPPSQFQPREAQAAKPNLEEGRRVVEHSQSQAIVLDPNPDNWGVKEVAHWVKSLDEDMEEVASKFKENRVRGGTLLELEKDDLVEMGITKLGDRKFLLKRIAQLHAAPHDAAPPPAAFSQPSVARPAPVAAAPPAPPAPLVQQMNLMQQHLEYKRPPARESSLSVSSSSGSPSPAPVRRGPTIPPFKASPPRSRPNISIPKNEARPNMALGTTSQAEGSPPGMGNERKHGEGEGSFVVPVMEPDEVPQRKLNKAQPPKAQPAPPSILESKPKPKPKAKPPQPQPEPQARTVPTTRPPAQAKKPKAAAPQPSVNRPPVQKSAPTPVPNVYVLHVTNLADDVRPEDLNDLFGSNVKFRVHFSSKQHDAYLEFQERRPAEHALQKNGTSFHGKPLRVVKSNEKKLIQLKLYQPPKVTKPVQAAPKPAPKQSPPKRNQPKRGPAPYMESPPHIPAVSRSPKEPNGPAVFRSSRPAPERPRREYSPGSDDRRSHRSERDSQYRQDPYDPYAQSSRNASPRIAEGRRTDDVMKDKLRRRLAQEKPRQEGEANAGPGYADEPVRRRRKRVPPPRDLPPDHGYEVTDDYSSSRTHGRDDQSERSDKSSRSHYSSSRRRYDDYQDDRYDHRYEDRYESTSGRYDDVGRTDAKPRSRRSSQHDSDRDGATLPINSLFRN